MKIKMKLNGVSGIIKVFNTKDELVEYCQNKAESIICSNDEDEIIREKIAKGYGNKFNIDCLIKFADGKRIK